MRRILSVVVAIAASVSCWAFPARAQTAGAYVNDVVEAHADWVAGRGRGWVQFRYITVGRYTNPIGATDTIASVGKIRCSVKDDGGRWVSSCEITSRFLPIKGGYFRIDGLLRNARVVLPDSNTTHRAIWTAKDDARSPSWSYQGGERFTSARATARASAMVKGTVFGEGFTTRGNQAHAVLTRFVEVGVIHQTAPTSYLASSSSRAEAFATIRDFIATL